MMRLSSFLQRFRVVKIIFLPTDVFNFFEFYLQIGEYIASNGGVVTAEELAPYLDLETTNQMVFLFLMILQPSCCSPFAFLQCLFMFISS